MRKRRYICLIFIITLINCLTVALMISVIMAKAYASNQYKLVSALAEEIMEHYPNARQDILHRIKQSINQDKGMPASSVLAEYGYTGKTFEGIYLYRAFLFIAAAVPLILLLLLLLYSILRKANRMRIAELTARLEGYNHESYDHMTLLPVHKEDDYSQLEDEIYKTVTKLRQTGEAAVKERQNLADNLADISHQIKTPVASISLMTQLLDPEENHECIERIRKQTAHLEQLIEALLTLSRIDAGVLRLSGNQVDIYTMLQLSLEAIDALLLHRNIQVTLPNHPALAYPGDMDWSIEAFINILKNCAEHAPQGGSILIDYLRNPLYVEIVIKDNGNGFSEKDLPHLFERFYRGENTSGSGVGIGLALAKAIIEQQNGVISAKNIPNEGACFIIRFYCH